MKSINKAKATEMIESSKGKFFTVTFTKKNKSLKTINCNWKKGNKNSLGYLTVYSVLKKGYKNIDPQTITALSISGNLFKVK